MNLHHAYFLAWVLYSRLFVSSSSSPAGYLDMGIIILIIHQAFSRISSYLEGFDIHRIRSEVLCHIGSHHDAGGSAIAHPTGIE